MPCSDQYSIQWGHEWMNVHHNWSAVDNKETRKPVAKEKPFQGTLLSFSGFLGKQANNIENGLTRLTVLCVLLITFFIRKPCKVTILFYILSRYTLVKKWVGVSRFVPCCPRLRRRHTWARFVSAGEVVCIPKARSLQNILSPTNYQMQFNVPTSQKWENVMVHFCNVGKTFWRMAVLYPSTLFAIWVLPPHNEEKAQNVLQNSSVGNFDIIIHKGFSGRIPYYTILTINVFVGKIVKFPTTMILERHFELFIPCVAATALPEKVTFGRRTRLGAASRNTRKSSEPSPHSILLQCSRRTSLTDWGNDMKDRNLSGSRRRREEPARTQQNGRRHANAFVLACQPLSLAACLLQFWYILASI